MRRWPNGPSRRQSRRDRRIRSPLRRIQPERARGQRGTAQRLPPHGVEREVRRFLVRVHSAVEQVPGDAMPYCAATLTASTGCVSGNCLSAQSNGPHHRDRPTPPTPAAAYCSRACADPPRPSPTVPEPVPTRRGRRPRRDAHRSAGSRTDDAATQSDTRPEPSESHRRGTPIQRGPKVRPLSRRNGVAPDCVHTDHDTRDQPCQRVAVDIGVTHAVVRECSQETHQGHVPRHPPARGPRKEASHFTKRRGSS